MNIAIFTDTYYPQINGVVEVIKNLKKGLEQNKHNVFIIAPKYKNFEETDKRVFRIISFPFLGLSEQRISFLYSKNINKKFILDNKIDIIHSQTPGTIGLLGIILAKKLKIPHIHHYQTFFEDYVHYLKLPKPVGKFSVRKFSKWFCNRVDLITVPTYPFKSLLESYDIKKEIIVWPSGIDIDKFKKGNNIRKDLNISENAFVLLFVGRIGREKNISFLLDLMVDLIKIDKKYHLIIAGDGPLKKDLMKYSDKLKITKNVHFLGYISSDKIVDIYHSSDVFVFASLTETQGLVTLEALASGLPVVAVSAYGIKYILENNNGAFLINLNKSEFIEKIELLKKKNIYLEIKKKALNFVQKYSYSESTKRIIKVYKDLLKNYK